MGTLAPPCAVPEKVEIEVKAPGLVKLPPLLVPPTPTTLFGLIGGFCTPIELASA